jgi:methyl halide transferase
VTGAVGGRGDAPQAGVNVKAQMESIYRDHALHEIPWNNETLPEPLTRVVTGHTPRPSTLIEFGCGAGNYVVALAKMGLDVTGVDIAETAIGIAKQAATNAGVTCHFVAADALGDLLEITGPYDFAYDWELLHHVFPEDRGRYIRNVHRLLRPRGTYFSVCFSEEDPQFGGAGKYRKTQLGTVLYFSSEGEIESLLADRFVIEELKTIDVRGKHAAHRAVCVLARSREHGDGGRAAMPETGGAP